MTFPNTTVNVSMLSMTWAVKIKDYKILL